jgi:hypothetical protein
MTARVVNLNVSGALDGSTLVTEFPPASVGNTEAERDLDIYSIDYDGDLGLFRVKTLIDAVSGFESSDIFIPQLQFVPGAGELIQLEVLAQTIPGDGVRVPIVNGNAGCIYAERRGGIKVASTKVGGSRMSFLLCPLTTQDQIVQAACCFCESVLARPCDPIVIDGIAIDPVVDPGPPPQVIAAAPFTIGFSSTTGTLKATDVFILERVSDGNVIFAGPATSYGGATGPSVLGPIGPVGPTNVGVYKVVIYRADDPNCGIVIDPVIEVI